MTQASMEWWVSLHSSDSVGVKREHKASILAMWGVVAAAAAQREQGVCAGPRGIRCDASARVA